MNKTKKNVLLMTGAITLLLVMEAAMTDFQSYAFEEHKKNGDIESSVKSGTEVDKKGASQTMDQDNLCYRGEDCHQANEGKQIVGKDNEAKGFNDQSANIQQVPISTTSQPQNQNTTQQQNQNTTQPPTPTPKTCLECFTSLLTPSQITLLEFSLSTSNTPTIQIFCDFFKTGLATLSESAFKKTLTSIGVGQTTANSLIECLKSSGVRVST